MWLAGVLLIVHGALPSTLLGVAILAIVYARNLEFVHACIHVRFVGRGRLNRTIGVLLSIPMMVSFSRWRREHAQHHRDIRKEGFRYEYDRLTTVPELFLHVFMLRHFVDAGIQILRAPFASFRSDELKYARRDYILIGCYVLAIAFATAYSKNAIPIMLFVAPLPLAAIVHTHIELPEHFGCQVADEDAFKNSRIMQCGSFITWFVYFNNYHAIHHWDARIPNERLPALFSELAESRGVSTERYGAFFAGFYRKLLVGTR